MSILTKLFVVLHVVLTLVLVPALIVYVNKTDEFAKKVTAAEEVSKREIALRLTAEQEAVASRGDSALRVSEATARISYYQGEAVAAREAQVASEAQIAGFKASAETEKVRAASAEEATKAVLKTVAEQETARRQIANELAEAQKLYWQLNTRFNVLVTERDGALAQVRRLREDLKFLEEQLAIAKGGGIKGTQTGTKGSGGSEVLVKTPLALRGVVTSTQDINGVKYATISLGSADSVQKGLQFKVHDRTNFLGYLTIDNVDPKEAVGRVTGPNINQIRAGSEVTTQY